MKGYMGKLLRVDLTARRITEEALDPQLARDYIGGAGLGIRLAYDEIPPNIEPLGPEAKLLIMTGPVTGTALGSAGRFEVVFKSPLTGILCDASSGGFWGSDLKLAGYDGLILQGAAEAPVYLHIVDGHVEIRDASHLWGMDAYAVQDVLLAEVGDAKARVLSIGPAGEREVLYACMVNDAGRMPGRGGSGAVMGHMKLKAIVVRGTGRVDLAEPAAFREYAVGVNKTNATSPQVEGLRVLGTPRVMDNNWPLSDIPTKNFSLGSQEAMCVNLGGKKMQATILVPHVACHRCSMGCSRWVRVPEGPYTMDAPGPEFETLGALGTNCMIDDLEFVSYAAHLCNIYGMDTLSCGGTIAFAMECFEKGLLTLEDTGGIELTFGNKEAMLAVIEQIAFGQGIGPLLALGSRKLAERIGHGAIDFAVQIKGLELPMHDARAFFGWGATYATGPRWRLPPARHVVDLRGQGCAAARVEPARQLSPAQRRAQGQDRPAGAELVPYPELDGDLLLLLVHAEAVRPVRAAQPRHRERVGSRQPAGDWRPDQRAAPGVQLSLRHPPRRRPLPCPRADAAGRGRRGRQSARRGSPARGILCRTPLGAGRQTKLRQPDRDRPGGRGG